MAQESFTLEWDLHRRTQYDSNTGRKFTEESFRGRTGFDTGDLKNQLMLDAGCGSGRYLEVVCRYGGIGIGFDGSKSVFAARESLSRDVELVRADILYPPFKEGSFDRVYSLGVLHHTSDPRRAFSSLAPLVKPDGELAVSVYSNEGVVRRYMNALGSIDRKFASVLSISALYRLCQKLATIPIPRALLVDPYLGPSDFRLSPSLAVNFFLPFLSNVKDEGWRTLDTFDYLSPEFQSKHTYREVIAWFAGAGYGDIVQLEIPVSVKGKKRAVK